MTAPTCICGGPPHHVTCPAAPDEPRPSTYGTTAAAAELARSLRALASKPHVSAVLRGLETALPETGAMVRAAIDDPGALIADALRGTFVAGRAELGDADRTIAAGLARAFGRGVVRGVRKGKP